MNYFEKLQNIIKKNNSNLVVGLDSDIKKLPLIFLKYKNPVAEFNKLIIESTKDIVAGYKLNVAFYECLEEKGLEALRQSLKKIPDDLIKICDAKRGDIGNTSELYARTYFDNYNFDSITLNSYMGEDSITPFLERKEKLVYILVLTSNKGYRDFQKLKIGNRYLFEIVIQKSLKWSKDNNVGFIFGANHTKEIKKFISLHPKVQLLIPGIGAQANDLKNLIDSLNTKSFVINSSRGILYSAQKDCDEKKFDEAVRESAIKLNNEINKYISLKTK
jgi:orotidine-5'-phosphate decarboxylase